MIIEQTTKIELTDKEIEALCTIGDAYRDCAARDCFECSECPMYHTDHCLALEVDNLTTELAIKRYERSTND